MNNDTPHQSELQLQNATLCACGCGTPIPQPKFPSRQRRFIVGHGARGITYVRESLSERFWKKVDKRSADDCWNWTAYRDKDGYGHIRLDNSKHSDAPSHRVSYELANGTIPDGMFVCHSCDNPSCVNPNHLFLGTHIDNMRDCVTKGRKVGLRGEKFYANKLTDEKVIAMRRRYEIGDADMRTLATEYGVAVSTVCNVIHRKSWKHIP